MYDTCHRSRRAQCDSIVPTRTAAAMSGEWVHLCLIFITPLPRSESRSVRRRWSFYLKHLDGEIIARGCMLR